MVARANIQDSSRDWIDSYRRSLNERHFHSFQLFIDIKRREVEFFFLSLDGARIVRSKSIVNILAEAGFSSRKRNLSPRASVFFLQPCVCRNVTALQTSQYVNGFDATRLLIFLLRIEFDCVCVYTHIYVYLESRTDVSFLEKLINFAVHVFISDFKSSILRI